MTIELGQKTINQLADALMQRLQEKQGAEYVRTSEAAKILGVSEAYLRQIKDRYPHKKASNQQQGALLFRRDALLPT